MTPAAFATAIAMLAGVAVGAVVWLLLLAWRGGPTAPAQMPGLGLPAWWRVLRPLAWLLSPMLAVRSADSARRTAEQRVRAAGLHPGLAALEVVAMQRLLGMLGAVCAAGAAHALGLGVPGIAIWVVPGCAACLLPRLWLLGQARQRRDAIARALPFMLDMTTLCVEGGLNVHGALQVAVDKGPQGPLRDELARMLGDVRAGASRIDACRQLAQRIDTPGVGAWANAMIQAETLGTSLGPLLRAQAEQRRAERFLQAEKRALQAPVKMLFPLIACIFPCTFIVIAFPIAMKLIAVWEVA